jgi:3',5'-cyclic AMP phosphodiesterase CpdA
MQPVLLLLRALSKTVLRNACDARRSDFGDDYYAFWVGGVFGVMLNSSLFSDPSKAHDLHDQQVKWFREVMEEASAKKPKHILVFMHHPVFLRCAPLSPVLRPCLLRPA